ncbi:hypothetical protein AXG89_30535 (plasmid) [Burkholderia sp. PAMC 26561]|nr:hypothetical protein AXG89_30535 [Burkholderia sp. PAMC 26561]
MLETKLNIKFGSLTATAALIVLSACGGGHNANPQDSAMDVIFMPGLQVNYVSCTPRDLLRYRIKRAVDISKTLKNPIFLAQGKGNPTTVNTCVAKGGPTEAATIAKILMTDYKIPENRIILEQNSTTTNENAQQALIILNALKQQGKTVNSEQLVTSQYHVYRQTNTTGADASAMTSYNTVFGAGTFTTKNSFSSSAFGPDEIWSHDVSVSSGWDNVNGFVKTADVNGDQKADLVAFRGGEVEVATSTGQTFNAPVAWTNTFLPQGGAWTPQMIELLGDVDGDGKADLVGLTDTGAIVSTAGNGKFNPNALWSTDFSTTKGWDATKHQFQLIDVNGDKKADLVAFGDDGTYVAYSDGVKFGPLQKIDLRFGLNSPIDPGSTRTFSDDLALGSNSYALRVMADVDGDGLTDVVVFGDTGVYVALQTKAPDATGNHFGALTKWIDASAGAEGDSFAYYGPNFPNSKFVRTVLDMTGNGRADLVVVADYALRIALSTGHSFEYLGTTNYSTLNQKPGNNANNAVTGLFFGDRLPEIQNNWTQFVVDKNDANWSKQRNAVVFGDIDGNGLLDMIGVGQSAVYATRSLTP